MTEELKRCPFCGDIGGAVCEHINGCGEDYKHIYSVKCYSCSSGTPFYFDADDAIEAWNRRMNDED